jgi:endonuclease/exonuclease/phosphatase family metal-dependent hydrolase
LEAEAIEGITLLDERGHYGNAVLTRLPVQSLRRHDISLAGREPRGAIDLCLSCSSREFRLVATHLGLRPGERRQQVLQLNRLFSSRSSGVDVILGDLNEWLPGSRALQALRRVFRPAPAPATFPARRPIVALDRILVRPALALGMLRVHRSPLARMASDHLPLVAEISV